LKLWIEWGLGIGDWGLGIGDWGLGPIPNPQSPIPNPQSPFQYIISKKYKKLKYDFLINFIYLEKLNFYLLKNEHFKNTSFCFDFFGFNQKYSFIRRL
jgi:hypothetical protein